MTIYRPIVVIEKKKSILKNIRIEICRETGSRSLSPFIRKIDIDELYGHCIDEARDLVILIEQCCKESQPFIIDKDIIIVDSSKRLLNSYPYIFISTNGSLKRTAMPPVFGNSQKLNEGKLLCGELYIDNLSNWRQGIKIRFRYVGARQPFHTEFTDLPFSTIDNIVFQRDCSKEQNLLKVLGKYYNGYSVICGNPTIEELQSFMVGGWEILLSKNLSAGNISRKLYFHTSNSGIEWLSDEKSSTEIDFLEAYLKDRNYLKLKDGLALLSSESISKAIKEDIRSIISSNKVPDTIRNNKEQLVLKEEEKKNIRGKIEKHVNGHLNTYQTEGVLWLHQMRLNKTGCLLADEMGLGKTIQVLAYIASSELTCQHHLVVCPASLKHNWELEINKFTPQLSSFIDIVTYDHLRINIEHYSKMVYDNIIIDEGQNIKNKDTKKFYALKSLEANQFIVLTGTPIENSIEDVWSYFSILIPEMDSIHQFLKREATNMEKYIEASGYFLHPYILRRTKYEVLRDLPEKNEITVYVNLDKQERLVYDSIRNTFVKALNSGIGGRINSIALEALLRLRQTCLSPSLLPHSLNPNNISHSSKLAKAFENIKDFTKHGHKTLVFSQFPSIFTDIEKMLNEGGIGFALLTGKTTDRKTPVEKFQNDENISVFLISLKTGGTGLNLTAADRIILLDDWWNPAVEEQAMGRAHRIGQKNPITVLRLVCTNTIEEKIIDLQKTKLQYANEFNIAKDISIEEIINIIES